MTRCKPIPAWPRWKNVYFYALAEDLNPEEQASIDGEEEGRVEFFKQHWPEIYVWLCLNISSHNWSVYFQRELHETRFVLAIYFDENVLFQSAFDCELMIFETCPIGT